MQFSVVVEGAVDGKMPGEESLAELQRFLRSTSSPQQLIQRLTSGKPFVIKRSLGYDQAVDISDRLYDFGLETFIDPPAKLEKDQPSSTQNSVPVATVTANKSMAVPKGKIVADAKLVKVSGRVVRANVKSATPIKASVHASSPKAAATQTKLAHNASTATAISTINKAAGTRKIPAPSPKTTPAQTQTAPAAANGQLAKAAAEIKALFRGPQKQPLSISVSKGLKLRLITACCLSMLLPLAYVAVLVSVVGLMLATAILGIQLLSGLPFFVPLLLVPVLILFAIAVVLALPLLAAKSRRPDDVALAAKDEPKLFMLVAALAKLVQADAPNAIHLVSEPYLSCRRQFSLKDFIAFRRALPSANKLIIGTPVLRSLSLQTFCGLTAVELARPADATMQRPYALGHAVIDFLAHAKQPGVTVTSTLRTLQQHITSQKLFNIIGAIVRVSRGIERFVQGYFLWSEKLANKLINSVDGDTQQLQERLVGTKIANQSALNLKQLKNAYCQSVEKLITKNTQGRYVDSLPDHVDHELESNGITLIANKATNNEGIIVSDQPLRTLVSHLPTYNRSTTAGFYQRYGLDMASLDVYSVEELFLKKVEDSRLQKIAHHYYSKWFNPELHWKLPSESSLRDLNQENMVDRLNACIGKIRYLSPDRANSMITHAKLCKQLVELKASRKVIASGCEFKFQHCSDLSTDLEQETNTLTERFKVLKQDLLHQNATMGERIALGLALEKSRKTLGLNIYKSLVFFDSASEKIHALTQDTQELDRLLQVTPKKLSRNYELHIKELSERMDENIKSIVKRAQHCPFQYADKRHSKLADLLSQNLSATFTGTTAQQLTRKSKILQKLLARAYKDVCDIAADIATGVESKFKIDRIKRI